VAWLCNEKVRFSKETITIPIRPPVNIRYSGLFIYHLKAQRNKITGARCWRPVERQVGHFYRKWSPQVHTTYNCQCTIIGSVGNLLGSQLMIKEGGRQRPWSELRINNNLYFAFFHTPQPVFYSKAANYASRFSPQQIKALLPPEPTGQPLADSFALVSMFNAANLTGGRGVTARWSALVGDGTDKDENIHVGRPASSFGISVPLRGLCFGRNQRFLYQPPK
jgi:hypothetical protein